MAPAASSPQAASNNLANEEDLKNERLQQARVIAREGRDCKGRGNEALVNLWREVSKPRKGGAIPAQPAGCLEDSRTLFQDWLDKRGLTDALEHTGNEKGWEVYRYTREPVIQSEPHWEQAFHGTWWYSVWLILETGIFLESDDKGLGHDFWEPGTYCSPELDTGLWYARPQLLFDDGVYHRIIFELRVNPERRRRNRARGGVQWVFPCGAVALHAVWVRSNAPPNNGEERVNSWEPDLEALPPGWTAPPPTVNERTTPWPDMVDPFPFAVGDGTAPPWMMGPTKKEARALKEQGKSWDATWSSSSSKAKVAAAGKPSAAGRPAAADKPLGVRQLGGLYGHWLEKLKHGDLHPGCWSMDGEEAIAESSAKKEPWLKPSCPPPQGDTSSGGSSSTAARQKKKAGNAWGKKGWPDWKEPDHASTASKSEAWAGNGTDSSASAAWRRTNQTTATGSANGASKRSAAGITNGASKATSSSSSGGSAWRQQAAKRASYGQGSTETSQATLSISAFVPPKNAVADHWQKGKGKGWDADELQKVGLLQELFGNGAADGDGNGDGWNGVGSWSGDGWKGAGHKGAWAGKGSSWCNGDSWGSSGDWQAASLGPPSKKGRWGAW